MYDKKHNHVVAQFMCCFPTFPALEKKLGKGVVKHENQLNFRVVKLRPNTKPAFD